MGKSYKKIEVYIVLFIGLFILLALLAAPGSGIETKTAYTRDDIHYISKERVDENIRYEYAKPGDYRAVQVPLDTIVVGASTIPENISVPKEEKEAAQRGEYRHPLPTRQTLHLLRKINILMRLSSSDCW